MKEPYRTIRDKKRKREKERERERERENIHNISSFINSA